MAELNIKSENMYNSEHIESNVKSKDLLDFHNDTYNEYQPHIEKITKNIKSQASDFKKIVERICSNDTLLFQREKIEKERQALYKKRNDHFQNKKFINPDQSTLIDDSLIRQSLNKDENFNYIGGVGNIVFDLACIRNKPRYAEALLRQTPISVDFIKLSDDQIAFIKDIAYGEVNKQYWSELDDLDTIEEELTLNKQYIDNHLSGLLKGIL